MIDLVVVVVVVGGGSIAVVVKYFVNTVIYSLLCVTHVT